MTTPPEQPGMAEQPEMAQPPAMAQPTAQPVAQPPAPQYAAPAPAPTKDFPNTWMNIVALVTGLLGMAIVPIIFGHLGVSAANKGKAELKGLGIAGLILGYLALVVYIILFAILVVGAIWLADNCQTVDGVTVCD
jgi:hypothetical protein